MNPRPFSKMAQAARAFALGAVLAGARAESPSEAFDAFKKGDYRKSMAEYESLARKNPDDPRLRFNAGAAAYRQNDLTNAVGLFESALATSDVKLQQKAYYNLGDTRYRMGEAAQEPAKKKAFWKDSLTNFNAALRLDPADTNAAANMSFVRRRLEELARQQPQQPGSGNDDDTDKDKDKDSKQDQSGQSASQKRKDKPSAENDPKQGGQDQAGNPQKGEDSKKDPASGKDSQQQQQGSADSQEPQPQQAGQASQPPSQDGQEKDGKSGQAGEAKDAQGAAQAKGQAGDGDPAAEQAEAQRMAEEAAKPGEMSQAQAARLLDSQKGNEKALVFGGQKNREQNARDARKRKPW